MTDTLRDRIAKVLHRQYGSALGAAEGGWDYEPQATQDEYRADSDAVIAELERQPGLQPDGSFIDPTGVVWRHTGTDWTDDPNFRP